MRWSRRRSPSKLRKPEVNPDETSRPQSHVHRSPGLKALLDSLNVDSSYQILDLGPALGPNVEFFSRFSCRLEIADFFGSLVSDTSLRERIQEFPEAVVGELLPQDADRFDVVLVWDLFNYLERDILRFLVTHLARICRPGAQMLAFISTSSEIPDQPYAFKIVDREHLSYEVRSDKTRPGPKVSPAEAERLFQGFKIDRAVLLRNKVREYLLVRRANRSA